MFRLCPDSHPSSPPIKLCCGKILTIGFLAERAGVSWFEPAQVSSAAPISFKGKETLGFSETVGPSCVSMWANLEDKQRATLGVRAQQVPPWCWGLQKPRRIVQDDVPGEREVVCWGQWNAELHESFKEQEISTPFLSVWAQVVGPC